MTLVPVPIRRVRRLNHDPTLEEVARWGKDKDAQEEDICRALTRIQRELEFPSPAAPGALTASRTGNVVGPSTSVVNNVASFDNTKGTLLKDSGVLSTNLVTSSAVIGNLQMVIGDGGARGIKGANWSIDASHHILPDADDTYNIGGASNKVNDLYMGGKIVSYGDEDNFESAVPDVAGNYGFHFDDSVIASPRTATSYSFGVKAGTGTNPYSLRIESGILASGGPKTLFGRPGANEASWISWNQICIRDTADGAKDSSQYVVLLVENPANVNNWSCGATYGHRFSNGNSSATGMQFYSGRTDPNPIEIAPNGPYTTRTEDGYIHLHKYTRDDSAIGNPFIVIEHAGDTGWVDSRRFIEIKDFGGDLAYFNQVARFVSLSEKPIGAKTSASRFVNINLTAGGRLQSDDVGTTEPTG